MYCYSNYVPLAVPGQPEKREKLTICGDCISAEDPSMVNMHDALQNFQYKLVQEAMQEIKKIKAASKDEISMDTSIDDLFAPIRTYQDIVTGMCRNICSRPQKVNQKYRNLTEMPFKSRSEVIEQM